MRKWRNMLFLVIVAGFMVACSSTSSKELTRSQAKSVIEASNMLSTNAKLPLDQTDVENGLKAGYWIKKDTIFGELLELTPKGRKYFTSFEPQIEGRIVNCMKPPKLYISEVTGITDAPGSVDGNLKVVEVLVGARFQGDMNDITKVLSVSPIKAEFVLRRYDDGWRVQQ